MRDLIIKVSGIISVLIALSMTELATGMPYADGGYLFIVRAFGPLVGSMMGWCLWLSLIFASAFYMIGFGHYMSDYSRATGLSLYSGLWHNILYGLIFFTF